jgi:hypothetical protein
MYRFIKILTLLTFLIIIIPGDKLAIPVGLIIIMSVLGIAALEDLIIGLSLLITIAFAIVSIAKEIKKLDQKINLLIILIFWAYLLQFTKQFIQHYDPISLSTLIIFLLFSTINLVKIIKKIANPQPNK